MAFFSLLAVLLLEYVGPLPYRQVVLDPLSHYAGFLEKRLNGGDHSHGLLAWWIAVLCPVLIAWAVSAVCHAFHPLLAWLWNVLILYLAMGFRQAGRTYTDIELALRLDDLRRARELLAEWRGVPGSGLPATAVARLSIEEMLSVAHRHVFGVLLCFALLPGPTGAVLYRLAAVLAEVWGKAHPEDERFGQFAQRAFVWIDALPARVTAAAFAIAGNFEEAVYRWRNRSTGQGGAACDPGLVVVLASGAGAVGVRLGAEQEEVAPPAEVGAGQDADVDAMQRATGLVWRALFLWLLLVILLGFARLVGG